MSDATDPHRAEALANAERRRAMLARLAEIGMELAEQIGAHTAAAMAAINEDKAGDPTRPFATVARAVRLTLALEARVDAQILALRNGKLPLGWGASGEGRPRSDAPRREAGESSHPAREDLYDREVFEDSGRSAWIWNRRRSSPASLLPRPKRRGRGTPKGWRGRPNPANGHPAERRREITGRTVARRPLHRFAVPLPLSVP